MGAGAGMYLTYMGHVTYMGHMTDMGHVWRTYDGYGTYVRLPLTTYRRWVDLWAQEQVCM